MIAHLGSIKKIVICLTVILCGHTFAQAEITKSKQTRKKWTLIVYVAADNDLRGFAARNIKQMAAIGSNSDLNICVELHIRISGNKKISRRYYIEQNKIVHVNADDPNTQKMDSGDPKTLVKCCGWAIQNYPAEHYAIVLWNHGTGVIDPTSGRIINASELFTFNAIKNKFELDRSIGFLDFLNSAQCAGQRGICWDDTTGNYLNNQKLDAALAEICSKYLPGKKIDLLGFDACLMAMLEVSNIVKKYAHILVSSQEVELGTGWNYQQVLQIFEQETPDKEAFARHIVNAYQKTYAKITDDFTLSAINLDQINDLEENISFISTLLTECMRKQKNNTARRMVVASRDRGVCTHFNEPSYIDMHHFYSNLQANLATLALTNDQESDAMKSMLNNALMQGCSLIKQIAFANTVGKNLSRAQGISIYFPENRVHYSYRKTTFAAQNEWPTFLTHYLAV